MTTIPTQPIEDTSGITLAYALMILGFPMCFVPVYWVLGLGIVMVLGGIFHAYRLRKKLQDTVIGSNHVQWIIRTFWMSSVYWFVGFLLAWALVTANANTDDIEAMSRALEAKTATPDDITLMMTQFHTKNAALLYWSKIVSFAPCLIFLAIRCIKGYSLSEKYLPVPNVKTWLF